MAEQRMVWVAKDGSYWPSESQALAYEMRLYLIELGRSAQAVGVDAKGVIDEAGMNALASFASSNLQINAPVLATAVSVAAQQPVVP